MLNKEELARYDRQSILPEIGIEGQEKLKSAKVLVIGAGGLGSPVLKYLTAAGLGTLGIADFDLVDESNLQRQILYDTADIGKPKAATAAEKLRLLNPWATFQVFDTKIDAANALEIIASFDIVVDGSDNFSTRYLVNDACILLNKPLVFGSIFKFEGQVTVFNYRGSGSYRCLFPEEPAEEDMPNCSVIGVLGVLPGIIGSLQANEVLKIILGIGEVMAGKLLVFDALSMNFKSYHYKKNEDNFRLRPLENYQSTTCTSEHEEEVSPTQLSEWIEQKEDVQLIDVRATEEYSKRNIGGLHIPLAELRNHIEKIPRNNKVVFYCQSGIRSKQAVRLLAKEHGFKNLKSLKGGLQAWYAVYN